MSAVLVDSSVWVDFFRGSSLPEVDLLDYLLKENLVCTTGLVMTEIIPSARTKNEFFKLKEYFNALPILKEPENMWNKIINWQFKLKRKGIHGVGIADLVITVIAKEHEKEILTSDRHFKLMEPILELDLLKVD